MTRLILELDQWTMKDSGVSEARPLGLGRLIRSLSSTAGKIQDEPMCLSTWMALFPEWRVWDVTFPGSHNSATYTRERIVTGKATAIVLPFLKKFIYCQDKAVYDQLCVGVRFFDLRVRKAKANSLNNEDPPWCAHAGYNTIALTTALAHIRQFLQKNPSEVVILSVRRDAGSTKKGCEVSVLEADFWLCKELRTYLGRCLGANTTVGELVARRQNVIYFYEEQERCIGESFKLILEPISKSKFRAIEPFDGDLQQLLLENGLDAAAKDAKKIPWSLSLEEFIKDAAKTNDDVHLSFEDPPQQEEDMEDNDDPGLLEMHDLLDKADNALANLIGTKKEPEDNLSMHRVATLVAQNSAINFDQKQGVLGNLYFASPLRTAESRIVKSWGKTSDPEAQILLKKIRIWASAHGRCAPRPPFVLKVLAGEVTAPNFNVDFTQGEVVKWWLGAAAAALTFQAVGNEAEAQKTNELLVKHLMTEQLAGRVNVVTHDYVSPKVCRGIVGMMLERPQPSVLDRKTDLSFDEISELSVDSMDNTDAI